MKQQMDAEWKIEVSRKLEELSEYKSDQSRALQEIPQRIR